MSAPTAETRDIGPQPLSNDQYTVGWLAALPHEAVAAKAALDQFHGRAPISKNRDDQNSYILGQISDHNVVIASLPGGVIGTTSATTTAMHMLASFPSIRIGLMVGIGAGIPKVKKDRKSGKCRELRDIRLGDVVVSQPGGGRGGVAQYDFGKALAGGEFRPSGFLNSPPRALLNAVSVLRQLHEACETRLPDLLSELLQKLSNARPYYGYPGQEHDRLFDAAYPHADDEESCDDCLDDMEILRLERPCADPVLHCGVIASGNQVIKDPAVRDRLGRDCICFEMEAAGLMNDFPCLVIRGICDYADSHKNDGWQRYAAVAAAACAKEVLLNMPKVEVEDEKLAREVLQAAQTDLEQKRKTEILDWLSHVNYTAIKADLLQKRCSGTGDWILTDPTFQAWIEGDNPTLFCSGIPGGGKSMAASVVIENLASRCEGRNSAVAFLYCKHDMRNEQAADHLLATLLRQLVEGKGRLHEAIMHLDEECKKKRKPTADELRKALLIMVNTYDRVYIVVDGLDECSNWDDDIRPVFLDTIRHLQDSAPVKLLATSRDIPIIQEEFQRDVRLDISARKADVLKYLQSRYDMSRVVRRNEALRLQIAEDISDTVDGM
ncbi:hypothetical protein BK809_0000183 [Diplodia seriata]|uniref:Nephrocystin 3-like N-terminal domain-containing protein n=1 Tax=Diplodia seriata TaxID=420778 RepID=A0A1S8B9Z1_9PEZI|nr:hypothetical protein BK809_0000183 [Diplodia seriata]